MRPASPSIDERRSARGPGIGIGIGNVAIAISRARKPSCHDGRAWQPLVPSRTTQRRATQGDGMEDAPGITCRGTRGSLWTVGGLEPLFLRARGMWTQVRARRSLVGVVACFWLLPAAPTARTSWRGWRKRLQLARANAQPVREHGSHGKHDGASRVTNHGRHVAAQTPPPPLPPSPAPLPPGHLARAPASPPPRAVCSKLRWFFSRQQVLSGCHSPWQLAIITTILQSRLSAAVLGGPQVPPSPRPMSPRLSPSTHPPPSSSSCPSPPRSSVAHDSTKVRAEGVACMMTPAADGESLRFSPEEMPGPLHLGPSATGIFPKQLGREELDISRRRDGEWRGDHPVGHAAVVVPGLLHAAEGGRAVTTAVGVGAR